MHKANWLGGGGLVGLATWLVFAAAAQAQPRPYIGFVYPAGGQQGTTFEVRLGGQGLDVAHAVLVTGSGVTAKVTEYCRRLNNQELQLLNEQVRELRRASNAAAASPAPLKTSDAPQSLSAEATEKSPPEKGEATSNLIARIEKRIRQFVQAPASAALSTLTMVEVTIAPDAEPGPREIRLVTTRGVSNPLVFHVGQVREYTRKPMLSATLQVLGKEALALRKRPAAEVEDRIELPGTVNGQIASGEVNRYRFEARKGQRLVLTTQGRQLIPFIADAVPGWFQPVLALYDGNGKEVAYDDDYRFNPDPTIFYEVARDGEYYFEIHDSLYRGREDFVYRLTAGELPFVTSLFPLGRPAGALVTPNMKGWNLQGARLTPPDQDAEPGVYPLAANAKGLVSNRVPFAVDPLPECYQTGPNHDQAHAQKVTLPVIINGRVAKPGEWDVFKFTGKSKETVVAEVFARRLDSPLDSVIKLTDANGTCLAFNDDHEDLGAGSNTHQADSYLLAKLPADGDYYLHLSDTAHQGGEEYGYRLRLSEPRPDFALRVVPSSIGLRSRSAGILTVYAIRRDGFAGPIRLALKDPPPGFFCPSVTLAATQTVARLTLRSTLLATKEPVNLSLIGRAKIGETEITHEAVPAEDRMQAFLWRHLVPASDLKALVFDPLFEPLPKRVARARPRTAVTTNALAAASITVATNAVASTNAALVSASPTAAPGLAVANTAIGTNVAVGGKTAGGTNAATNTAALAAGKPAFTKQQVAARLRQLRLLFEDGLLTEDFYAVKVAECEAAQ